MMRIARLTMVGIFVMAAACRGTEQGADAPPLTPERADAVTQAVRAFAQQVASDVTRVGPAAWRQHFADIPEFFMASEGTLQFADSASATRALPGIVRKISRIELRWGDPVRVDPLTSALAVVAAPWHETIVDASGARIEEQGYFTGIAERRAGGWQFRNLHWYVAPPEAGQR